MNFIKIFFSLIIVTLTISMGVRAADEVTAIDESKEKEEEKEYIKDITKEFSKYEGFFEAYQDTETSSIYLVVDEEQLNKEFIYFAHVVDGVVASRRNRGSYLDNGIFKIEKYFDTLRLSRINTAFSLDERTALSRSSGANISDSVLASLPIKASNEDENRYLVDVTSLFLSEELTPIKPIPSPFADEESFRWGQISPTKSKIERIINYPKNTDIEVELVIESQPSFNYEEEDAADPRNISIKMRYSFIGMPKNNFEPRMADQSIGYFSEKITDLSTDDATPYLDLIHKWDLQKKDPELAISEPIKPILFWLENTTPLKFRDYITEGLLAWNEAFLKAGIKNAIEVKIQPDDADWDAGDIRYNVLRWTSSPNAPFGGYGPSFVNPRTGEIIGADIMLEWVYATNRLTINDIFNSSHGSTDCSIGSIMQEANMMSYLTSLDEDDPEILKQSIIRLTLHEVGHTLGLNHNFKASFLHNSKDVHNKKLTQKVGLTGSVMEYPAVNIAPLGVEQGDYYDTRTGPYDLWAIEFGYTPQLTAEERTALLSKSKLHEHMFANDSEDMRSPGKGIDPRAMINDLSSEPIIYAEQRIKLVNDTISKLPSLLSGKASSWEEYRNAYKILLRETSRSLDTVSRYIGGVYVNRSTPAQGSDQLPYEPVPALKQKEAMRVLADHAFSVNAFPINGELLNLLQIERRGFDLYGEHEDPQVHKAILNIQNKVFDQLLSPWVTYRITDTTLYGNDYEIYEFFNDLNNSIFEEDLNFEVSYVRKNLQTTYVRRLIKILAADYYDEITTAAAYDSLRKIEKMMKKNSRDPGTKAHRSLILWIIDSGLNRAN
jgi:hypothetical protein|tara:strand:- start:1864 stop:4362 length:2499 start_codon:yes stop_codon:yes gene_type:complete